MLTPGGNIDYCNNIEFKINRLNSNSLTITLTPTQFEWIMFCIENQSKSKELPAEKENKYVCYENLKGIDGTIGVSVIDRKAKFGVIFSVFETQMLKTYDKILLFLIKYQEATQNNLYNVVSYITSSIYAEKMKISNTNSCLACKGLKNEEHTCLLDLNYFELSVTFKSIILDDDYKEEFIALINYYADLLNINDLSRNEAINIYLPMLIGNTDLFDEVLEFYNKSDKNWKIKAVSQLNSRKKRIEI